jgi:hypothetical protein
VYLALSDAAAPWRWTPEGVRSEEGEAWSALIPPYPMRALDARTLFRGAPDVFNAWAGSGDGLP